MTDRSTARTAETGPARNATFSLHPEAHRAINDLMAAGKAASKNALVEELLLREWRKLERERREASRLTAYQEAMRDPLFTTDVSEISAAFAAADAESARRIE
jgi:hypothetical protein